MVVRILLINITTFDFASVIESSKWTDLVWGGEEREGPWNFEVWSSPGGTAPEATEPMDNKLD